MHIYGKGSHTLTVTFFKLSVGKKWRKISDGFNGSNYSLSNRNMSGTYGCDILEELHYLWILNVLQGPSHITAVTDNNRKQK